MKNNNLKPLQLSPLPIGDTQLAVDAVETPLGWLSFALTCNGLKASTFMYDSKEEARATLLTRDSLNLSFSLLEDISIYDIFLTHWRSYFVQLISGYADPGIDIPVDDRDWTEFAKKVYHYLRQLPEKKLFTYGELATAVKSPGASRAVGMLMKKNPIPPVVPCHIVVSSDGKLGGFSASGGIQLKQRLLELEGIWTGTKSLFP